MKKSVKFSPEVQERAVRMVVEAGGEHDSQWAAIESIAAKIGCTAETLRRWVRRHERETAASARVSRQTRRSASRNWSARCVSCAVPTRS